jgi:hypothetical protein
VVKDLKASWQPYFLVFLFGVGDVVTTSIGLSLGLQETRMFFVPFLSTAIFFLAILLERRIPLRGVRPDIRELFLGCLALVALSPVINNIQVIVAALLG